MLSTPDVTAFLKELTPLQRQEVLTSGVWKVEIGYKLEDGVFRSITVNTRAASKETAMTRACEVVKNGSELPAHANGENALREIWGISAESAGESATSNS